MGNAEINDLRASDGHDCSARFEIDRAVLEQRDAGLARHCNVVRLDGAAELLIDRIIYRLTDFGREADIFPTGILETVGRSRFAHAKIEHAGVLYLVERIF